VRVVADTNVVISGLLWGGPPNEILRWARDGLLELIACEETAGELKRVLQHKRFSRRMSDLNTSPQQVFAYFMNLATFVPNPAYDPGQIEADPFDNVFLALASEGKARLIISGDRHLLSLKEYRSVHIVTPSEAVRIIETLLK
jgi:putative PIN family toxin of toxin-antitoxin system